MRFRNLLCVFWVLCLGAITARAQTGDFELKPQIKWPSTQPIGIWHLSEPKLVTPANPAGWNTANGPRWPQDYLNVAIPVLKSINAQGVIIWDIEGSSTRVANPEYIGAPDTALALNPGMDYDAFFAALRKQKIIPGVCLRPSNIIDGKHVTDPDPFANLSRKITFARGLWKCRIFYIDSNTREQLPDVPNAWVEGPLMPATLFARLHKKFPDCLLIPEHKDPNYHLWTIPYREGLPGQLGTPDYILRDIPRAKSALNLNTLNPDQIKANWTTLKSNNCILLMNAWWPDPNVQTYLECSRQ